MISHCMSVLFGLCALNAHASLQRVLANKCFPCTRTRSRHLASHASVRASAGPAPAPPSAFAPASALPASAFPAPAFPAFGSPAFAFAFDSAAASPSSPSSPPSPPSPPSGGASAAGRRKLLFRFDFFELEAATSQVRLVGRFDFARDADAAATSRTGAASSPSGVKPAPLPFPSPSPSPLVTPLPLPSPSPPPPAAATAFPDSEPAVPALPAMTPFTCEWIVWKCESAVSKIVSRLSEPTSCSTCPVKNKVPRSIASTDVQRRQRMRHCARDEATG